MSAVVDTYRDHEQKYHQKANQNRVRNWDHCDGFEA